MGEQTYEQKGVALTQLETALRLFSEGQDFFSVITLAGAAEEILGKLLTARGGESSLTSLKKAVIAMHHHLYGEPVDERVVVERANRARTVLKHLKADGAPTFALDARQEAIDLLERAIDNYWSLESWLTPAMEEFERAQRAAS